jgi:predicted permease
MSLWRQLARGVHALLRPQQADQDLTEEVRHYISEAAAEHIAHGMTHEQAVRAAMLEIGNTTLVREQVRTSGWEHVLETILLDVRYALRRLRATPGFTITAVATLALGVGATTAMFSVANTLLLRPLPYPTEARLVTVATAPGRAASGTVSSYPDYLDWRALQHSFDDMGALAQANFVLLHGEARRVSAALVSASFFSTFGVTPEYGRRFSDTDDSVGAPAVMVVSDAFARSEFGDPQRALGQSVLLNGASRTIVGVIADRLRYPSRVEAWLPIETGGYGGLTRRGSRSLQVFAVLRRGVSIDVARRDLAAISARLAREYPASNAEMGTLVVPLRDQFVGSMHAALVAMIGATLLVLLIACANVAALQLARAAARTREIAVRAAIGASRRRIIRQLLTESVLLAVVSGAAGACLAVWGRDLIVRAVAPGTPAWMTFDIDDRALAFALVVSALAGIAFGIAPALGLAEVRAVHLLRGGTIGSSRARLQRAFVVAEIALSIVLVVGTSLALESVWRMQQIPLGLDPAGVLAFGVTMEGTRYDDPAKRAVLVASVVDRLGAVQGVTSSGAADRMPINGCCSQFPARIEGQTVAPGHEPLITGTIATPGYFQTLGIRLVAGRTFTDGDDAHAPPVTVINETFARRYWPHGDAIGRHVNTGVGDAMIVGVVQDIKQNSITGTPEPQFFRPYAEDPWTRATFAVRVRGDPMVYAAEVRRVVRAVDATMPVFNVVTLGQMVDNSTLPARSLGRLLAAFAGIALLLAATGLYGLISFLVARRTRELGLRVALGAEPSGVAALVVRQAFVLALMGVLIGLGAAMLAARWLASTLYGVSAAQPAAYLVAAGVLAAATLVASYGPARRASRADPMVTLRAD